MPMFSPKKTENSKMKPKKLAKKLETTLIVLEKETHLATHKPYTRSSKPKSKT